MTKFDIDSISPAYVDVTFAQIGTQKFTVEVEASVDPAEGYYLGEKQASPAEVTLRGPVDELARVARVVARVESDEKRDRTMLDSAALEFLDADGHAITDSSITVLEGEQVEVTIPVLKLKEVPLKFEFSNVPAGYDPAELNASISPATIRIAGAADTVDGIESVNAGFINLARVQLGKAETLKIQLSEGLVNVDDVQEATVTFDTSGYGEPRAITVSDIRVVNAPSGVDVKVITESINNVTLVGEAEELAAISPSDVIAQVDASAQNITVKGSGQQQFSAQIIVTGHKDGVRHGGVLRAVRHHGEVTMLLVRDIRLPLAAGEQEAVAAALKKTGLPRHGIKNTGIAKLSVDARHGRPSLVYTVALELADEGAERSFERFAPMFQ